MLAFIFTLSQHILIVFYTVFRLIFLRKHKHATATLSKELKNIIFGPKNNQEPAPYSFLNSFPTSSLSIPFLLANCTSLFNINRRLLLLMQTWLVLLCFIYCASCTWYILQIEGKTLHQQKGYVWLALLRWSGLNPQYLWGMFVWCPLCGHQISPSQNIIHLPRPNVNVTSSGTFPILFGSKYSLFLLAPQVPHHETCYWVFHFPHWTVSSWKQH